jgi:hypothetical protein
VASIAHDVARTRQGLARLADSAARRLDRAPRSTIELTFPGPTGAIVTETFINAKLYRRVEHDNGPIGHTTSDPGGW